MTDHLRTLIRNAAERPGWSYRRMADQAASEGLHVSHSQLQKLATGKRIAKVPDVGQLRAIAAAVGVPFRVVRDAALHEAGLIDDEGPANDVDPILAMIDADTVLTERDKRILRASVELMKSGGEPSKKGSSRTRRTG